MGFCADIFYTIGLWKRSCTELEFVADQTDAECVKEAFTWGGEVERKEDSFWNVG